MAVKIGVIGCGVHGMHHVRILSKMESVDFVGIYDANETVSKNVAKEFSVTAFSSLEEFAANVDCASIAVPTTAHLEAVQACFAENKHVLVEKPIALSIEQAEEMNREAEERGLVFGVGHIERFNPSYRPLIDKAVAPLFIESHRLSVFNPRGTDVAVVLDLMIHDIDIVLDMVKRPVKSVNAVGVSVVSDEVDIANARLEFEGGCVANLTASRISQRQMRKLRAFRKNSYISMDFLTGESEVFAIKSDAKPLAEAGSIPQLMDGISYEHNTRDDTNALEDELSDFIAAVETGRSPRVSGKAGQKALDVAIRVMESMETSRKAMGNG